MFMWKKELDPYVSVLPTSSSAFLPIILKVPGYTQSIHIAIYLPTAGRDSDFISALSQLDVFVSEAAIRYQCPIYIRGDA